MPVKSAASAFQVHPSDNVATLLGEAAAGAQLEIVGPAGRHDLTAHEKIELGHKVAITASASFCCATIPRLSISIPSLAASPLAVLQAESVSNLVP